MTRRIENLADLEALADVGRREDGAPNDDIHIRLNGGFISRKTIGYDSDNGEWFVYHHIDDTASTYATADAMFSGTHIGLALERGALYVSEEED